MSTHTPAPEDEPTRRFAFWHLSTWSRRAKLVTSIIGALMAGGIAFAVTTWTVGLGANSSSEAQSGAVGNITIVASASPAPGNLLYPGGTGDVVAKITNPNSFLVTITAINLPTNTTYAAGYSDSGLGTASTGCTALTSLVNFVGSTAVTNTSHNLATAINVPANGNINVIFTSEAAMGAGSDNTCQNTYFKMPSFTGVTATVGTGTATATGSSDTWS